MWEGIKSLRRFRITLANYFASNYNYSYCTFMTLGEDASKRLAYVDLSDPHDWLEFGYCTKEGISLVYISVYQKSNDYNDKCPNNLLMMENPFLQRTSYHVFLKGNFMKDRQWIYFLSCYNFDLLRYRDFCLIFNCKFLGNENW